jgi:hypothetical protein
MKMEGSSTKNIWTNSIVQINHPIEFFLIVPKITFILIFFKGGDLMSSIYDSNNFKLINFLSEQPLIFS